MARAGFGIARAHQHREQVAALFAIPAPPVDRVPDGFIERVQTAAGAQIARRRRPGRHHPERFRPKDDLVKHGERGAGQRVGPVADLHAEERLAHDLQRHVHHLGGHVDRLADLRVGAPIRQHRLGRAGHQRAEIGDALAMEGRLRQPPLPEPEIAVAGQQPVAGDGAQQVVLEGVLAVVAGVVLQDVLDAVRVADQIDGQRAERIAQHVAVLRRCALQEGVRPDLERAQILDGRPAAWAGGRFVVGVWVGWRWHALPRITLKTGTPPAPDGSGGYAFSSGAAARRSKAA